MKSLRARDLVLLLAVLIVAAPFATALTRGDADWTVDPPPRIAADGAAPSLIRADLFEAFPTPLVHAPTAVETASGDLLVAWYGGSDEAEPDVGLYLARKPAGASSWQAPRRVLDRDTDRVGAQRFLWSIGNPALHRDDDGRLWLFHVGTMAGWSTSWIEVVHSDDDGETWSVPRRLVTAPGPNISTLVKTRPFAYGDGRIGLPAYHELEARFALLLVLDRDGYLVDRIPLATADPAIQPAIAPLGGRELIAMMRPYGPPYRVRAAHSADGGRHWRDLGATDLPNPGTAVAVAALGDNEVLLAYNANERRRSDLALALSRDGGATWSAAVIVDRAAPGDRSTEIAYPALLVGDDGRIHLVYSVDKKRIRHIALNRAWLDEAFPAMIMAPYDVVPYLIGAAIAGPFGRVLTRAPGARIAAAALGAAAMAIPVAGTPLTVYAATLTGTLSVPTIALLAAAAIGPVGGRSLLVVADADALLLAALAVALLVFSGAYGVTEIGLYRTGYTGLVPAAFTVAAIGLAWLGGRTGAAWVWVAALAVFHLGLLPSPNLWDHLADPFLALAAALWLPLALAGSVMARRRRIR